MCGRYTLARSQQELSERFGIKQLFMDLEPRYNIAPTQSVPVVIAEDGERKMQMYQWGLIPSWVKDLQTAKPIINARCESLAEKASFKHSFKRRRCIVPAEGFFEWKKQGKQKQPMFIRAADQSLLGFAGLWDEWRTEEGEPVRTFCIITTDANEMMSSVHDRMPAILDREAEMKWLDESVKNPQDLMNLLHPCPEDQLKMHEVSQRVNSFKEDTADLIEPVQVEPQVQLKLNLGI
jgi:putative SOS response-associated peptidase YedK